MKNGVANKQYLRAEAFEFTSYDIQVKLTQQDQRYREGETVKESDVRMIVVFIVFKTLGQKGWSRERCKW